MSALLVESSISDFSRALASSAAVPGGGSVSALAGALAADLLAMVCTLSIDRPEYESAQELLRASLENAQALSQSLMKRVDLDAEAFDRVMKAFKMPKDTQKDKDQRKVAIQAAFKGAAESPLGIAKECLDVLKIAGDLLGKFNTSAMSDLGVGSLLAKAGLEGAVMNVRINLPSIQDHGFDAQASSAIETFLEEGAQVSIRIYNYVNVNLDQD
jgi:methenyltetrahydrofolate cyclohydrolase